MFLLRKMKIFFIQPNTKVIRTNYFKAKIDNTKKNCQRMLCGDWDEIVNHIISEYSKLVQKEYKSRHDWLEKIVDW